MASLFLFKIISTFFNSVAGFETDVWYMLCNAFNQGEIMLIKELSRDDCYTTAYLFYKISHLVGDIDCKHLLKVFDALCKKLGKKENARRALDLHIEKLISQGTVPDPDNQRTARISINFCRCIQYGEKNILSAIIAQTFFSRKPIKTSDEEVAIPKKVIAQASNTAITKCISSSIKLSKDEANLLTALYRVYQANELYVVIHRWMNESQQLKTYSCITGFPREKIYELLDKKNTLRTFSLVTENLILDSNICECMEKKSLSPFYEEYLNEMNLSELYKLKNFHIPENKISLMKNLLMQGKPVSLLFYGATGSGKIELAKSLAHECGLRCFVFKNVTGMDDYWETIRRLNLILRVNQKDAVIIIDEAENILETGYQFDSCARNQMSIINKIFESCKNKVIWIANDVDYISNSVLIRFTYSLSFYGISNDLIRCVTNTKLRNLKLKKNIQTQVLDLCSKYRVPLSSIDNVVCALTCVDKTDEKQIIENAEIILKENSSLVYGKRKMCGSVNSKYDLSVLNTSICADEIVSMVERAVTYESQHDACNGIRMLFYGLSGTGKTEFAKYISQRLGKEILLRRASDILGKYVGESEKNIRKAFDEAENENKILLFDEADSFFADRNSASQSWERTMVNEFLTQMEEFSGILICTTNLRNIMDAAMQRRFHIMVEFNALTENGIKTLLGKYFGKYEFDSEQMERLASYASVTPGDFGSLSDRLRFMSTDKLSSRYIFEELSKLQDEKDCNVKKRIGFGA